MVVLASNAPRRQQILTAAGILYTVRAPNVQEERLPNEAPTEYVRRLAKQKALSVTLAPGEIVLAGDTVVVVDEYILEKPRDAADALRMLRLLSGPRHEVITRLSLPPPRPPILHPPSTNVPFLPLTLH